MANTYFNHVLNRIAPGTRALDSQINNIADEIAAGFDKLPAENELKEDTSRFATSVGGTSEAITVTLGFTPTLLDGFSFSFRATATNTSDGVTINVNSTGVKNARNSDGSAITPASIASGAIVTFTYDLTNDYYLLTSNNNIWGKPTGVVSTNPEEYCPGYPFVFVDTTTFRIEDFDVTNLFAVSRRLRFIDGENEYFGTINAVDYNVTSTDDTTISMTMEGGDVLTNTIGEVCLTTGTAGWSAIAGDPFSGNRINGIATGAIGASQFWVIVGNGGLLATSTDAGVNFQIRDSDTTANLVDVAYNPDDESFLAVGPGGVYTHSTDGINWTEDTTKIPALTGSASYDIDSVTYIGQGGGWSIFYEIDLTSGGRMAKAYSTDDTGTWTEQTGAQMVRNQFNGKSHVDRLDNSGSIGELFNIGQDGYLFDDVTDLTAVVIDNESGEPDIECTLAFYDTFQPRRFYMRGSQLDLLNQRADDSTLGTSIGRDMARSDLHNRFVVVADEGKIMTVEYAISYSNPAGVLRQNGARPITNFTAVDYNVADGVFCACNDIGQVLRSTNGIN